MIGMHYTLTGSSAFLLFVVFEVQDIGTTYTEMHHESKESLDYKDFQTIFNDKKQ